VWKQLQCCLCTVRPHIMSWRATAVHCMLSHSQINNNRSVNNRSLYQPEPFCFSSFCCKQRPIKASVCNFTLSFKATVTVTPDNQRRHYRVWGADRPGWHPPGGDTRMKKKLWLNLQRTVDTRGRTGKKVRGDTRVKSKKWQWWAKKVVSFFSGKN